MTPALCAYLLPGVRSILEGREPALATALKRGYQRLLPRALDHPQLVMGAAGVLLIGALATIPLMGRAFLPAFNEGALVISAVTLPGTSLAESNALGSAIERLLLEVPEVVATARRTGRAELDEHVQGVESAEIDVRLEPDGRPREVVLQEIRDRLSLVPGTNITIGQPISHRIDHMLSGSRANVAVKIFGNDLGVLRALGNQAVSAMQDIPGLVDLALEPQADIPTVRVHFDRAALARHGLPAGQAALVLETALLGREVGQIIDGQMMFPLILRYAPTDMADLDAMWQTRIDMPAGARVPLGSLADIVEDRGPNFIGRENGQRRIVVTANVAGRDLGSVVTDIRERVAAGVTLPDGYRVEYGGQFEAEAEASRLLLGVGLAAVAGIFLILVSAFRSARDAAIVMINLPLALIGGVVGVFLGDGVLSIAALIGFHLALRHRHPQRHHARLAHPALARGRRGDRCTRGGDPGLGQPTHPDLDDRAVNRAGAHTGRPRVRRTGQRDPGSPRAGDRVRVVLVDRAEYVRGAGDLLDQRAPGELSTKAPEPDGDLVQHFAITATFPLVVSLSNHERN